MGKTNLCLKSYSGSQMSHKGNHIANAKSLSIISGL